MGNAERGLRWRVAGIVALAIMWIMWGLVRSDDRTVILIEFGMMPELAGTAVVMIDGDSVGILKRRGARTQSGFKVPEGDHVVSVRHPEFGSEPARVTTGFGAGQVRLMLDVAELMRDGVPESVLVLQF